MDAPSHARRCGSAERHPRGRSPILLFGSSTKYGSSILAAGQRNGPMTLEAVAVTAQRPDDRGSERKSMGRTTSRSVPGHGGSHRVTSSTCAHVPRRGPARNSAAGRCTNHGASWIALSGPGYRLTVLQRRVWWTADDQCHDGGALVVRGRDRGVPCASSATSAAGRSLTSNYGIAGRMPVDGHGVRSRRNRYHGHRR